MWAGTLPVQTPNSAHPAYRVSIMSNTGVKIRDIGDMTGHKNTNATETVYRHVIAPSVTARMPCTHIPYLPVTQSSCRGHSTSSRVCGHSRGSSPPIARLLASCGTPLALPGPSTGGCDSDH